MRPGRVVAGKYRLESKLGEGGFGAVFLARQIGLDRLVALKLLHVDALLREETRGRFRREAHLAQTLSHPNIVRMFDYGETEDGIPFIAWEMLEGHGLDLVLRTAGAMAIERVVHIGQQTLKALMEAHSMGIVHRDIKPANLFLCNFAGADDYLKVLDFGIAAVSSELASQTLTREGNTVGTPAYMAPEQVLDEPLDGRADLYSLGLTLAECVLGRPVFEGASGMRIAILQASPEPPPIATAVLSSVLGPIIERATRKNREERFHSAEDMLAALDRIAAPRTTARPRMAASAPSGPMAERAPGITGGQPGAPERSHSQRWLWGLAALLVLAAASVGGVGLWLIRRQPSVVHREGDRCEAEALPEGSCTFDDPKRRQLASLLSPMGYRPSAVLVKNSYQAVFDAPKGAIVTLVIGSVGLMPNGSGVNRSNLFACWRGCRVTVLVSGRSQSPEERDDTARIVNEALER